MSYATTATHNPNNNESKAMAGATASSVRSKDELVSILRKIDMINPVIRLMLEFEARTGLRYVDASQIKWADVMINGVYRESFTLVMSKSYNKRLSNGMSEANARQASLKTIHLNDEMIALLDDLKEFTGGLTVLFESTHHHAKGGKAITINYVNRKLKEVAIELGLPYQLSTHSMRKSFSMFVLEAGGQIHDLQRLLCHSSLAVTDHYVRGLLDNSRQLTDSISFSV